MQMIDQLLVELMDRGVSPMITCNVRTAAGIEHAATFMYKGEIMHCSGSNIFETLRKVVYLMDEKDEKHTKNENDFDSIDYDY